MSLFQHPVFRIFVAAGLAASLTACGDDDDNGDDDLNPLDLIAIASDVSLVASFALQAQTLGELALPVPFSPGVLPAAADTLLPGQLTCPLVTHAAAGEAFILTLDYGNGCASDLDGTASQGKVDFEATREDFGNYLLEVDFADFEFSRDGRSILDGVLFLDGTRTPPEIDMQIFTLSGVARGANLNAEMIVRRAAPPGDPQYCQEWNIEDATGTVGIGGLTYTFSSVDTLLMSTCCPYPTSGEIVITTTGASPTFLDYGDGTCDNRAILRFDGEEEPIILGYDLD